MYFHTQDGVVKAVDGVSYTLDRGETLGVVGESGSGKSVTSLSRSWASFEMPPGTIEGGDVRYRGKSTCSRCPTTEMQQIRGNDIAMIFQDPMTVAQPGLHHRPPARRGPSPAPRLHQGAGRPSAPSSCSTLVGIPNPEQRVKDYPHQFSGGMRQRVMIAMALACDPDILIADEPTTALDVTIQAQIVELMKEMQEKNGNAIIMITHDLGVVADVADKIMVMYAGSSRRDGHRRGDLLRRRTTPTPGACMGSHPQGRDRTTPSWSPSPRFAGNRAVARQRPRSAAPSSPRCAVGHGQVPRRRTPLDRSPAFDRHSSRCQLRWPYESFVA